MKNNLSNNMFYDKTRFQIESIIYLNHLNKHLKKKTKTWLLIKILIRLCWSFQMYINSLQHHASIIYPRLEMSESERSLFKESRLKGVHSGDSGITSLEIINDSCIFSCNDDTILLHNLNTNTKKTLYSGKKSKVPDELACMKSFSLNSPDKNYLYTSNSEYLQLFDLVAFKQINKYKFSKETVNSIELNKAGNLVVCSDDAGNDKKVFFSSTILAI